MDTKQRDSLAIMLKDSLNDPNLPFDKWESINALLKSLSGSNWRGLASTVNPLMTPQVSSTVLLSMA